MKYVSAIVVIALLAACSSEPRNESAQSPDSTAIERELMMQQVAEMITLINDIDDSLSQVADDILEISAEPGIETPVSFEEAVRNKAGRVVTQLAMYRARIKQHESDYDRLQRQFKYLKRSETKVIDDLKKLLEGREAHIGELQGQLREAVQGLEREKEARMMAEQQRDTAIFHRVRAEQITDDTRDSLRRERRAWFIAASEDDLQEVGFEWKGEATFLNFGGHLAPPADLDRLTFYQPIDDVTQWSEFVAPAGIERIHSAHADVEDSYVIEGETLRITDWRRFWSAGKYLTIALNEQ